MTPPAVAIPTLGWRLRAEVRQTCRFEKTIKLGTPLDLMDPAAAGPLPKGVIGRTGISPESFVPGYHHLVPPGPAEQAEPLPDRLDFGRWFGCRRRYNYRGQQPGRQSIIEGGKTDQNTTKNRTGQNSVRRRYLGGIKNENFPHRDK